MTEIDRILTEGIEQKRKGNYDEALKLYNQASKIDPFDPRIFGNKMKVLIGTRQYNQAMRNILMLTHLNIVNKVFERDPMAMILFQQFLPRFNTHICVLSGMERFDPGLVLDGVSKDERLADLIYRAHGITFHAGHCYVGSMMSETTLYPYIFKDMDFKAKFENFNKSMLGNPAGEDYRNTNFEGYFLSTGFMFIHMNLRLDLQSLNKALQHYFDENTIIRSDFTRYRNFLLGNG